MANELLNFNGVTLANILNIDGIVIASILNVNWVLVVVAVVDKWIFGYWDTGSRVSMTNLVSNTWVVSTDTTWVWTARSTPVACTY